MKTTDFLPVSLYEAHKERMRTPRRALILGAFTIVWALVGVGVELEARVQKGIALSDEEPSPEQARAAEELDALYTDMSDYVARLDPLAQHLRMPTVGSLLAGLGPVVGGFVLVEDIDWEHVVRRKGIKKISWAEVEFRITALVRGDQNLIELPERLRQHTGYAHATIGNTELVDGMPDTVRAEVLLRGELMLPGFTKPKMRPEEQQ